MEEQVADLAQDPFSAATHWPESPGAGRRSRKRCPPSTPAAASTAAAVASADG